MRGFQFRLEKVRRVKEILEEKAKYAWIKSNQVYLDETEVLAKLENHKLEVVSFARDQKDIQTQLDSYRFLQRLERQIEDQKKQVQLALEQSEKRKAEWIQAKQEWEILNKLKEKHFEDFRKTQAQKEQKTLDDMKSQLPTI